MATDTVERLNLPSLIRRLDSYISQRLEIHRENKQQSLADELNLIIEKMNSLLVNRCQTHFAKGKNKGSRCLRASFGNKCKSHDPGHRKKLENKKLARLSKTATLEENILKGTSEDNTFNEQFDNQVDIVDWGEPLPAPQAPLQKYYSNPDKELCRIYDNVYLDRDNTIVVKNTNLTQSYNWVFVCKYRRKERVLVKFSNTVVDELKKQKLTCFYDYTIDENWPVDVTRLLQGIAYMGLNKASLKQEQPSVSNLNSLTPSHANNKPTTTIDKLENYNKYSRAPKIQLGEELLMSAQEFTRLYNKQPSKEESEKVSGHFYYY